jgi:hypothetical protein
VRWLCSLPLPRNTFRLPGISKARWHRYLFRRHVKDILRWTVRLNEGDPAGFSKRVNWLIRKKFFPDRDGGSDGQITGRGEAGCGSAVASRNPQCTSSLQEAPKCCDTCYTSTTSDGEPGAHGLAIGQPQPNTLVRYRAGSPTPSGHGHGDVGPRAGGCATNPEPRRVPPEYATRSGERDGSRSQQRPTGASEESCGESPGPTRRSPWSPPARHKRPRR